MALSSKPHLAASADPPSADLVPDSAHQAMLAVGVIETVTGLLAAAVHADCAHRPLAVGRDA